MAEKGEGEETIEGRKVGAMWDLEQKLDQPMEEEAHKLKNMQKEKVNTIHNLSFFLLVKFFLSILRT